jgi:GT2 family glycosyltransferase
MFPGADVRNAQAVDWRKIRRNVPHFALGVEGADVQARLALACLDLAAKDASFLTFGRELLLWRWRERPLDPLAVRHLPALETLSPFLPPRAKALLLALGPCLDRAAALRPPAEEEGADAALGFLSEACGEEDAFVGRLALVQDFLTEEGAFEALGALRDRVDWSGPLALLAPRLAAEQAFFSRPADEALAHLERVDPEAFGDWGLLLRAMLAERLGNKDQATALLTACARRLPWHVNLLLTLDAMRSPPAPAVPASADAAVLVYTWNNAALFEKALAQLMTSDLGGCPVVCLDNGSSKHADDTAAVLDRARENWPGRLSVISLPVNIGAPAARNWMLSLPQVRERAFAAFVDDDAFLPPNWLASLLHALRRTPKAGAAGARVADAGKPWRLQSADVRLLPPENAGERFSFFDPATRNPDLGLFAYTRPCLSVTGCCHVLRREALEAAGGFDIRFSPSQLDDFERDLRAFLAGFPCVYDGRVLVRHSRRTGGSVARSAAGLANAAGNRTKLDGLYGQETIEAVIRADLDLAWDDLLGKVGAPEKDGAP